MKIIFMQIECLIKTYCGNMNSTAHFIISILLNSKHLAIIRNDLDEEISLFSAVQFIGNDYLDFISGWFYSYGQNYLNKIFLQVQFVIY